MADHANRTALRNRGLTAILLVAAVGFCVFVLRAVDGDAEPMGTWQLVEMGVGAGSERTLIVIQTDSHDPRRFLALYCTEDGVTARIGVGARVSGDFDVTVSRTGETVLEGIWTDDDSGARAADPEASAELTHLLLDTSEAVQLHVSGRDGEFGSTLTVSGLAAVELVRRVREGCQLDRGLRLH